MSWPRVGDRVALLDFKSGTAGLTMLRSMRDDVGKAATIALVNDDIVVLRHRDGVLPWAWPRSAIADVRTRGIAMGHVRARARMERFREWLKRAMFRTASESAAGFASPEAWMLAQAKLAPHRVRLVGAAASDEWGRIFYLDKSCTADKAPRFLKSKAWASLPWQQEPGGER